MRNAKIWTQTSLVWLICITAILIPVKAQPNTSETKTLRIISRANVTGTESYACASDAAPMIDTAGEIIGCDSWEKKDQTSRRMVQLRAGVHFEVEPLNGTLISSGGKTILKYGDFANLMRRAENPLGWILYSNTGKVLASQKEPFDPNATIAMSEDGYFVIASRRANTDNRNELRLTLYSPSGEELFSKPMGTGVFSTKIALQREAKMIAVGLTDNERYRDGTTSLALFSRSGDLVNTLPDFRYINTLTFAGSNQQHLLAFAINSLTLLNPETGKMIWRSPKFYRLAGPFGLSISEDGKYINTVTAELTSESNRYLWRSNLITTTTGELLTTIDIPELRRTTMKKVITWIGPRSFKLTTDKDSFTVNLE